MIYYLLVITGLLLLLSMAFASSSFAPWVPIWKKDLPRVFKLADLKPGEIFYDLGCGDGKTVFYANKHYKANAIGLEIAIPMYFLCKFKHALKRNKNVLFKYKNLFLENLEQADVVYFFGMPKKLNKKLKHKLEKELRPGTRVISYVFPIQGWDHVKECKPKQGDISIYLYKI